MTKKIRLAYFGSPSFSARVLQHILTDTDLPIEVVFVCTQPDKPVGRKQILTPTPVKTLTLSNNLPVFDTLRATRNALHGIDLCLVYAFGQKIPAEMLKIPSWGFWNIHLSLLPLYRGVSPIAYPLLLGDTKTGVSLMQMDAEFDHGPILDQEEYEIKKTDIREQLEIYLSDIGYRLFKKNIQLLLEGKLQKKEQNHSKATYTRLLTKQDGYFPFAVLQKLIQNKPLNSNEIPPIVSDFFARNNLPFTCNIPHSTCNLFYLFRALSPWPGIWTLLYLSPQRCNEAITPLRCNSTFKGKRLKITKMRFDDKISTITHIQLEGKKEVDRETFEKAYSISLH